MSKNRRMSSPAPKFKVGDKVCVKHVGNGERTNP